MINREECNQYLKSLYGKKICFRWQEIDINNPNPYTDRFNFVKYMEINMLFLDSDYYLVLNDNFINLNPKCYESVSFNYEKMEFNYKKGSINTTLSFRFK